MLLGFSTWVPKGMVMLLIKINKEEDYLAGSILLFNFWSNPSRDTQ
jgi:hypothetical protein